MKKIRHINSIAGILVVLFLFTSLVPRLLNLPCLFRDLQELVIKKKVNAAAGSDSQLLFEEKERESKSEKLSWSNESQQNLFLIYLISNPSPLIKSQHGNFYSAPRFFGNTTDVPVYLAKRTFQV